MKNENKKVDNNEVKASKEILQNDSLSTSQMQMIHRAIKKGKDAIEFGGDTAALQIKADDIIKYAMDKGLKIEEKDPIIFAMDQKLKIAGKDPIEYAFEKDYKITSPFFAKPKSAIAYAIEKDLKIYKQDPVQYAIDNNTTIDGKSAVDYKMELHKRSRMAEASVNNFFKEMESPDSKKLDSKESVKENVGIKEKEGDNNLENSKKKVAKKKKKSSDKQQLNMKDGDIKVGDKEDVAKKKKKSSDKQQLNMKDSDIKVGDKEDVAKKKKKSFNKEQRKIRDSGGVKVGYKKKVAKKKKKDVNKEQLNMKDGDIKVGDKEDVAKKKKKSFNKEQREIRDSGGVKVGYKKKVAKKKKKDGNKEQLSKKGELYGDLELKTTTKKIAKDDFDLKRKSSGHLKLKTTTKKKTTPEKITKDDFDLKGKSLGGIEKPKEEKESKPKKTSKIFKFLTNPYVNTALGLTMSGLFLAGAIVTGAAPIFVGLAATGLATNVLNGVASLPILQKNSFTKKLQDGMNSALGRGVRSQGVGVARTFTGTIFSLANGASNPISAVLTLGSTVAGLGVDYYKNRRSANLQLQTKALEESNPDKLRERLQNRGKRLKELMPEANFDSLEKINSKDLVKEEKEGIKKDVNTKKLKVGVQTISELAIKNVLSIKGDIQSLQNNSSSNLNKVTSSANEVTNIFGAANTAKSWQGIEEARIKRNEAINKDGEIKKYKNTKELLNQLKEREELREHVKYSDPEVKKAIVDYYIKGEKAKNNFQTVLKEKTEEYSKPENIKTNLSSISNKKLGLQTLLGQVNTNPKELNDIFRLKTSKQQASVATNSFVPLNNKKLNHKNDKGGHGR